MTKVDKTGFYPKVKGKKRKMAELLMNPDVDMTITDMCKEIGVSRQTFYNWQQEMDFKNYVNFLIGSYTQSELPRVWKALTSKATGSKDVQAIKLFFDLWEKFGQSSSNESEKQSKMLEAIEKAVRNGNN